MSNNNQRIKKASLNIVWLLIYEVVIFASNLILPRLIIQTYGSAYNGMISSITQFLNFVSILRLGIAGSTRVALYKTLSNDDKAGTSAIVRATELYMRKVGLVIVFYVLILAVGYPMILDSDYGFLNVSLLVLAIGAVTFSQYFYGITCNTLLQADQRLYIFNIFQSITVVANTIISSVLIVRGFSIQTVKIISAIIFALNPIILNKYVKKSYSIDSKCKPDNSALSRKRDVMGHSIANIIHENTDVIVITLFCDIKLVSVYTVYNFVMNGLRQVLGIFTTGAESVFGSMWARGESNSVKRNLSYFEHMIALFISVIFSGTLALILPFVKLYTKGVTDINYVVPIYALVIITAQAIFCIRTPYQTLVQAAGFYKETKKAAYFEAALNIITSVILVRFIGIIGTAVGTLLANIFRTFQYMTYVSKYIVPRSRMIFVRRFVWTAVNVIISSSAGYLVTGSFSDVSWLYWALSGLVMVIISGCVALVTSYLFYRNDLMGLLNIAKRMVKRR